MPDDGIKTSYRFAANANWTTGRNGFVTQEPGISQLEFSAPPEFQGKPGLWTPEHFLLAAVATCFITTFRAIAELSKFEMASLEARVEGTIEKEEGGFRFTHVIVRPVLAVHEEADRERGLRLLSKTERACLVSRSLRSEIVLEPNVVVSATTAAH